MLYTDSSKFRMIYLVAEVFEHPQFNRFTPGASGVVLEPIAFTGDIGFRDNISSIRLYSGRDFISMHDPIQVGVHALCPGPIPPTTTRFDYFRVLQRPIVSDESSSSIIPF